MTPLPPTLAYQSHRDILAMVGRYHYVTSRQVQRYLGYAHKQYANKRLRELTQAKYLSDANWIPKARKSPGQPQTVWSLTPKGVKALRAIGIEVARRVDYKDGREQSFMAHTAAVNDALIACELFALEHPTVELTGFQHEQSLKRFGFSPTPDGWTRLRIGEAVGAILWEIDRGTEDRRKWSDKVRAYRHFLSGSPSRYNTLGGNDPVQVAVVVRTNPTQRVKPAEERCADLIAWTQDVLDTSWGRFFAFTAVDPVELSPTAFFTQPNWFSPHASDFTPLIPKERLG